MYIYSAEVAGSRPHGPGVCVTMSAAVWGEGNGNIEDLSQPSTHLPGQQSDQTMTD